MQEGQRYEDFNKATDKIAEYGLTGLILGGAGLAVAKKAGLLAGLLIFLKKFWVLLIPVVVILRKWIFRLFKGKPKSEEMNPPQEQ